jgi:hypothetical protein
MTPVLIVRIVLAILVAFCSACALIYEHFDSQKAKRLSWALRFTLVGVVLASVLSIVNDIDLAREQRQKDAEDMERYEALKTGATTTLASVNSALAKLDTLLDTTSVRFDRNMKALNEQSGVLAVIGMDLSRTSEQSKKMLNEALASKWPLDSVRLEFTVSIGDDMVNSELRKALWRRYRVGFKTEWDTLQSMDFTLEELYQLGRDNGYIKWLCDQWASFRADIDFVDPESKTLYSFWTTGGTDKTFSLAISDSSVSFVVALNPRFWRSHLVNPATPTSLFSLSGTKPIFQFQHGRSEVWTTELPLTTVHEVGSDSNAICLKWVRIRYPDGTYFWIEPRYTSSLSNGAVYEADRIKNVQELLLRH